jgi:hypothetical protein
VIDLVVCKFFAVLFFVMVILFSHWLLVLVLQ